MIERWHRNLKAAIMCHSNVNWTRSLSTVMLGLRSNVLDTGASPAEYVFGTTLRIPGEFILPEDFSPNPQVFLEEFREHMREIKPAPVGHKYKKKIFLYKDLKSCTHVYKGVGPVKNSLERPYTGPHRIINRTSDRVYEIHINGTPRQVSVEHLKPAYFLREDICNIPIDNASSTSPPTLKTYARKKQVRFNV